MKKTFYYFALLILLNSCYISKDLDRVVKVSIDENFIVNVSNTSISNYTGKYSLEEYHNAFIEGMLGEFATGKIEISNTDPEFIIKIDGLTIEETSADKRGDDGQMFVVTTLRLNSDGTIQKNDSGEFYTWTAEKMKTEKVTNSRSTSDVISGSNQNHTVSRKKTFTSSKAVFLAEKCGRRAGARIINEIARSLK